MFAAALLVPNSPTAPTAPTASSGRFSTAITMSFAKSATGRLGDSQNSLLDAENAPPSDFINSRRGAKRTTKPEPNRLETKRVVNASERRKRERDLPATNEPEPESKRPSPNPEPAGQHATRSKDPPAKQTAPEAKTRTATTSSVIIDESQILTHVGGCMVTSSYIPQRTVGPGNHPL